MATNVPFTGGLTRSRTLGGGSSFALNSYPIQNGMAKNIFAGDPVRTSTGWLDIALNTAAVLGVARSFHWVDKTTKRPQYSNYFPSGTSNGNNARNEGFTTPFALVDDDPHGTWIIKADASVAATLIGELARVTNAGTGSTVTGRSACEIDPSGSAVSAGNAMFRILGPYRISDVTSAGALENIMGEEQTLLEVVFSNHI